MLYGLRTETPQRTRLRRDQPQWAKGLATDLIARWNWLAGAPRPWIVATLTARLGPDWTAAALVRHVSHQLRRPVLQTPDKPVAYLRYLLEQALTGDREPPHPARRFTEHRRTVAQAAAATTAAAAHRQKAQLDARDRIAIPAHLSSAAGELAALRARLARQRRAE